MRMLGRIKADAARANAELGVLDTDGAERIAAAGEAVAAGDHDDQFPIDVFQTGSGTNTNMNVNEVVVQLAGDGASTPTTTQNVAVLQRHLPLRRPPRRPRRGLPSCCPRWAPRGVTRAQGRRVQDMVKPGRTHLMDAVPVTLGQEFAGYATQIKLGADRVRSTLDRVAQDAAGRDRNRHRPQHPPRVRRQGPREVAADTGLDISQPADPFEAQGDRDALVELSGALKTLAVSC